MWRTDLLAEAAAAALALRERELADEHAVHGLDALGETRLHLILAQGFRRAGWGVLREQPYPHEWRAKRGRRGRAALETPEHRDRRRCDLVVTPEPDQPLVDPLQVEAAVAAHQREILSTLFAPLEAAESLRAARAAARGVGPDLAFWLEVKTVGQYTYSGGISGPNRAYASELRGAAADLRKLEEDPQIHAAALLLVMFTADPAIANHDLHALFHLCLDRHLPIRAPDVRSVPVRDLIGNAMCTVCVLGLSKVGGNIR